MNSNRKNIWPTLLLCSSLIGIGGVAGFVLRPVIMPTIVADEEAADDPHDHEAHGANVVEIMENAMNNLNLQIGKLQRRDYFETIRIPAKIVERIPQGRRHVTAPIGGRVKKVYVAKGQAVIPGEKLFELQVTDNSLSQSQVDLLGIISEIKVNQQQVDRLRPLVDKGVVARKRILDVELEAQRLQQKKEALTQGLGIRGMDDTQIENLVNNQKLFKSITVYAPAIDEEPAEEKTAGIESTGNFQLASSPNHSPRNNGNQYFTVESIEALEGTNLELGNSMCELTHHGKLLIKGLAFESDVRRIATANEKGWKFSAHFGAGLGDLVREGLSLYQIENHVDTDSQTYPIFIELDNEVVSESTDDMQRLFVNWRFKPGQRTHLEVPINEFPDQWVVPVEAVVYDGPQAFIFQKINHTHESPEGTIHEFAKTSVKVVHKNSRFVVLDKKDQLIKKYEDYALDKAYQLNLVLKTASSSADPHAGHTH